MLETKKNNINFSFIFTKLKLNTLLVTWYLQMWDLKALMHECHLAVEHEGTTPSYVAHRRSFRGQTVRGWRLAEAVNHRVVWSWYNSWLLHPLDHVKIIVSNNKLFYINHSRQDKTGIMK
jgi:hypothetical protein